MTVSQIFDQTPEQRRDYMREMGEPTHYGKPAAWTMRGYLDAVKPGRTPTHRADGPPTIPARYALLGKANTND